MSAITLPLPLRRQRRNLSLLMLVCSLSFVLVSGLASVLASDPASAFFSSPQQPHNQQRAVGRTPICSGVAKNPDGSYHFSWLRVDPKTGYIMDERNCIVDLRGFNTAGTEYGDAVSSFPGLDSRRLAWFNRMFNMNYIRLNLNVGWWNTDIYVPNAQMHYRAWI